MPDPDPPPPPGIDGTLILIGLRGAGKSAVGRMAALRLRAGFIDLDDLTLVRMGCGTVAEAWVRGEPAFRKAEVEVLRGLLEAAGAEPGPPSVIALGGGTPTAPGAADILRRARQRGGRVIYLRARPETLRERLRPSIGDRPSLTGADPLEEIGAVFAARDGLYRALADLVIDTDGLTESQVEERIAAAGPR